ncbi:hypothetical protein OIDMADRAFT_56139 [Oidiodendron maius Zn]|uniref:Uncharacterized protein n=1 Tax=Oidiodendron maius (strain Zn) TaxID=913774 RepID=A0A0C3H9C5_OIDMZ|nr:hypothetical protein OIDMADRAFT_56139 [Oidiodendron maius Zn]
MANSITSDKGASSPIQEFPTSVGMLVGGTVKVQKTSTQCPCKNGTWNAFQLLQKGTGSVCAYPIPTSTQSGNKVKEEETAAEGVIVINRYDWEYYDNRGKQEISGAVITMPLCIVIFSPKSQYWFVIAQISLFFGLVINIDSGIFFASGFFFAFARVTLLRSLVLLQGPLPPRRERCQDDHSGRMRVARVQFVQIL